MLERLLYTLELAVVGISVVFSALIFFSFIIWLMKFIDAKISEKKTQKTLVDIQPESQEIEENDENLVAVIAAAVYVVLGKKARVKHIQFLDNHAQEGNWAASGRLSVMSSHNINKRI